MNTAIGDAAVVDLILGWMRTIDNRVGDRVLVK
jgi:hypothetical protein